MTSKTPDDTAGFLALIAAAALFAVPGQAQEAEEGAGSEPDAAAEPETPTGTGAEPEAGEAGNGETAGKGQTAAEGETPAAGEADGEGEEGAEDETDGGPLVVEAEEGSVIDDQTFEGEDDDFTPSEEIPVDQPIPFPVDI